MKYASFTTDGGTLFTPHHSDIKPKHLTNIVWMFTCITPANSHTCWIMDVKHPPSLFPQVISVETQIKSFISTKEKPKLR